MIPINRTYAPIQAFVDELARCGVEHAVTCPGSRNAPLALTLAAEERIRAWSVIDERSAGFFALGIAKATGRPVAVTCTSGTAAANLTPAVIEANEARVPLIVLTADRPPELREVGAGQSIDQIKLFGTAVRWFVEVGTHEPSRETAVHHRALACRAHATAAGAPPGPVHVNFPLREPLAPVPEELDAGTWDGRPAGRPWVELRRPVAAPDEETARRLGEELAGEPRGAIVCGPTREDVAAPVARLAAALGWPLLAEPTSGARCGPHERAAVVAHYDPLLAVPSFAAAHAPALVLRFGDTPTSKPLRAWLAGARQVVVDPDAAWHEPTRAAETVVVAGAAATCAALEPAVAAARPDPAWLAAWRAADELVPAALAETPDPFEPKVYAALADVLPEGAAVWLSSSMPVRDVEAFFPQSERKLRFLANRGANGIDGVVSSAAGAAAVAGDRCWLLTGELALLHDVGGLLTARRSGVEPTIVCVNNGGGGIFDFLPVAAAAPRAAYEEHIATPADIDLSRVADAFGLSHVEAGTLDELRAAAGAPGLIEVKTDREQRVRCQRALLERLAAALAGRA